MKRIEISNQDYREMIANAANEQGIELGSEENALINEIVTSAPKDLTTQRLGVWSKRRVDEIIGSHPELSEKAELIRSNVRNEINILLLSDRIEDLKKRIPVETEAITPKELARLDEPLYQSIIKAFRGNDGNIDWNFFQKKSGINIEYVERTVGEAITELNEHLKKDSPLQIGPYYIRKNYPDLYHVFWRDLGRNQGIQWEIVLSQLDKNFRDSWRALPVYEKLKPKEQYSNPKEVEDITEKYREELFKVFDAKSPQDREVRDRFFLDLLPLAKKGNRDAEEKILEFMGPIVNNWINLGKLSKSLDGYKDDVDAVIKRCIYLSRGDASFIAYVFSFLRLESFDYKRTVSYNKDYHDKRNGNYVYHDEPTDEY